MTEYIKSIRNNISPPVIKDINFIKSLKSHNVKIQTASDAHCPEDVGLHITELLVTGSDENE